MNATVSQSICSDCRHERTCMYFRQASKPVFHCEEFEPHAASAMPSSFPIRKPVQSTGPAVSATNSVPGLRGLCKACDWQASCRLPRPKGGVWQCSEYR